ncbi:MAG: hypothetical protein K6G52_05060 [Treponemataceae bacterium]|nr:hypothetical protein [Treponemataceae bacterium]
MNSQAISSIPLISQNQSLARTIKDGSKVFVRVLERGAEQGKYTVSFEGSKFEITSKVPLEIGSSFKATAQIQNGTIKLVREAGQTELAVTFQKFSEKDVGKNEQLSSFMNQIGLESDEESFKLLQLMFQSKIKINPPLIKKALAQGKNISKKNGKISKLDSSIASLELNLKDINDTEEAIEQIVPFDGNGNQGTPFNQAESQDENQNNQKEQKVPKILELYEDNEFLGKEPSFLTAYNHIKLPKSDLHNVILPFEYEGHEGAILLFIDTFRQKTVKINLCYTSNEKKYYFVVYLDGKNKIEYFEEFLEKNDAKINSQTIINMLEELFPGFSLKFDEDAKKSFLMPTDEQISIATELI